jgi:hypothetical protein
MTDTTGGIAAALADLQTQLPRITKDQTATVPTKTGGSYKYSYADLAQVSHELLPLLGKLGLSFTSRPTIEDGKFVLAYELLHISNESRSGVYPLPDRGTPQEIGGAITYARRYCLCAVTGLAPDDDQDAALAERAASRRESRSPRQQQATPARETPAGITGDQQRKMQALFRDAGVLGRDEKLAYATEAVGRPLGSATELTRDEAGRVIDKLTRWVAQSQPGGGE